MWISARKGIRSPKNSRSRQEGFTGWRRGRTLGPQRGPKVLNGCARRVPGWPHRAQRRCVSRLASEIRPRNGSRTHLPDAPSRPGAASTYPFQRTKTREHGVQHIEQLNSSALKWVGRANGAQKLDKTTVVLAQRDPFEAKHALQMSRVMLQSEFCRGRHIRQNPDSREN